MDHQELARCLFDESNDAFLVFNPTDGTLVDVNPRALKLTGFTHLQLMQRPLPDILSSKKRDGIERLMRAFQSSEYFHTGEEYYLRCANHDQLPVRVSASRIHTKPAPLGLAVVFDISQQRQYQDELRALNEELELRVTRRTEELETAIEELRTELESRVQLEAKLREQLDELRRWSVVTEGRELRVLELKGEVNELLIRLGEKTKYEIATSASADDSQDI